MKFFKNHLQVYSYRKIKKKKRRSYINKKTHGYILADYPRDIFSIERATFFFSSSDPIFLKMEQNNRSIWVDIKSRDKPRIKNHVV